MSQLNLTAPDGTSWPVNTEPTAGGVALIIGFTLDGAAHTLRLEMARDSARLLARSINADAGDAIERTFPHPQIPEA